MRRFRLEESVLRPLAKFHEGCVVEVKVARGRWVVGRRGSCRAGAPSQLAKGGVEVVSNHVHKGLVSESKLIRDVNISTKGGSRVDGSRAILDGFKEEQFTPNTTSGVMIKHTLSRVVCGRLPTFEKHKPVNLVAVRHGHGQLGDCARGGGRPRWDDHQRAC